MNIFGMYLALLPSKRSNLSLVCHLPPLLAIYVGIWPHVVQRESPADQVAIQREWVRLTEAFIKEWGEVTKESFAFKVMARI